MTDYIERDAALKALCADCCAKECDKELCQDYHNISVLPAADVREVVLCRDCYAYKKDPELARATYLDPEKYCAILRVEMPEDGYCWYGCPNCGADMRPEPPKEET